MKLDIAVASVTVRGMSPKTDEYFKKVRQRTLKTDDPRKVRLQGNRVIVHNHVVPSLMNGYRGFRAWTQEKDRRLVECPCYWAGYNADGKVKHYRFRAALPSGWRQLPAAELRKKLIALSKRDEKWRMAHDGDMTADEMRYAALSS